MVKEQVFGNRKTILIGQDSFYIALPIKLSGTANATIKAGEPLVGDISVRTTEEFKVGTTNVSGLLLHEVVLDSKGKGNGTILVAGCVDRLKLDMEVLGKVIGLADDLKHIIITEGSAI